MHETGFLSQLVANEKSGNEVSPAEDHKNPIGIASSGSFVPIAKRLSDSLSFSLPRAVFHRLAIWRCYSFYSYPSRDLGADQFFFSPFSDTLSR